MYKFLLGPFWIGVFGFGLFVFFRPDGVAYQDPRNAPPPQFVWIMATMWVIGTIFVLLQVIPLKSVQLSDDRLIVSNFRRRWEVLPSEIAEVRQSHWLQSRPIRVRLRHQVEGLGDRFTFIPPRRLRFAFWRDDRELQILRELASRYELVGH
jgi:hypothetical protein